MATLKRKSVACKFSGGCGTVFSSNSDLLDHVAQHLGKFDNNFRFRNSENMRELVRWIILPTLVLTLRVQWKSDLEVIYNCL